METIKEKKNVIIVGLIFLLTIGIAIVTLFSKDVKLYDDETTKGNTSCNLLNGGLFCEEEDKIYFANPYDQNMLYSMNKDLTNVKKVCDDNVSYLNVAGDYIFYTKRNDKKEIDSDSLFAMNSTGLYRLNRNTRSISKLYQNPTQVACLFGNNVYYQHFDKKEGLLLYAAKIDGSKDTQVLDEGCAPSAIQHGYIYYTGTKEDHNIKKLSIDGGTPETLLEGNFTGLSIADDYLYFLDMNSDYALKRMPVSGGEAETLVNDRIATYNVTEDGSSLYCQIDNGKDNGIYQLDIATKSLNALVKGNLNHLHLISNYLFYEKYDGSVLYKMDLITNTSERFKPES